MNTDLMFSSKTDLWATPQDFFDKDNLPKVFLFRKPFRKLALFYREKVLGKKLSPNLNAIKITTNSGSK